MKLSRLFLAASLAAAAFVSPAFAAGLFSTYPAAVQPLTGIECIPADTNLTQGLTPATECMTPGNITSIATGNPLGVHPNIPIGGVAYGSLGTSTTPVSGTVYWTSLQLPLDKTVGSIACLNGGTASTNLLLYGIWNNSGVLLANTAIAGTLAANADTFQSMAIAQVGGATATTIALKAGRYWVGWQTNGTTTRVRTVAASTYIDVASTSATGTFGTLPALTVPTTFTADKAPICYVGN